MQSFSCRQHCVPENSPLLWVILNGLCAIVSISLFGLILSGHHQIVESVSMEYSIIRSMVWLLGIGLTLSHLSETSPSRKQWFAVVVAIYFLVDSVRTIYLWTLQRARGDSLLVDMCINVMIFTVSWIDSILFWRKKTQEYASLGLRDERRSEDPWSTRFDDDEVTGGFDNVDEMEMI